jgi:NAD(P)-dependent dehydrogenase (short-subunit alcohol dehydrogenase family)
LIKRCDIRKEEEVREMVDYMLREFGHINILVRNKFSTWIQAHRRATQINNSGANFLAPAKDISPNGWRTVIDICLVRVYFSKFAYSIARRTEPSWFQSTSGKQ